MSEMQKKGHRNPLLIFLGLPIALFLLAVIVARGGILFGSLFDLAVIVAIPLIIGGVVRRWSLWPLLGLVLFVVWVFDVWLYVHAIPLREFVLAPLIRWLGGFRDIEFWWLVRTVIALLFLAAFFGALKARKVLIGFTTGLIFLWSLGFAPLFTQRMALATSVAAPPAGVEITPEKIQGLVANRPGQLVDVHASTDNNLAWGRQPLILERGDILVVQFIDEPDPFYFRNMRRNPEAMRDPALISGTYSQPCGWKYEDFRGVARSSMPLPKHPLSTTAVRLGPNGYQPLVSEWQLFAATHKGEVNLGYNFPRGLDNHMNSNANGHRRFMIWVIRAAEARASSRK